VEGFLESLRPTSASGVRPANGLGAIERFVQYASGYDAA
jgi:hypothetical protein